MNLNLENKVVLITGGSRGIGLRTARIFAREGCRLAICGRSADTLKQAQTELEAEGVEVITVQADVSKAVDATRLVDACVGKFDGIDILVNNVGGAGGSSWSRLMESSDEDWRFFYEYNVVQTVRMIRESVPHMRGRDGANVINIGSISGWRPQLSGVGQYGAAKAGLIFLSEILALDLACDGIRVNCVSPGGTFFDGASWHRISIQHPEAFERFVRGGCPMGRLGTPEEVADVVVFLASPRSHWINGRHIPVDGLEQPHPCELFDLRQSYHATESSPIS